MIEAALIVWIITHTIAVEIPVTANSRKPLNCQLCLSGWVCIAALVGVLGGAPNPSGAHPLAVWGASVLLEALYQRLYTIVM